MAQNEDVHQEGVAMAMDVALLPTAGPWTQTQWRRSTNYPASIGGHGVMRTTAAPPQAPRKDDQLARRSCAFCLSGRTVEPMPRSTPHPALGLLCRMCQVRVESICGLIAAKMTVQLRVNVSTYAVMARFFQIISQIEQEHRAQAVPG